jgi:hypothetical protein
MGDTIAIIVVILIAWLIYFLTTGLLCLPIWYLGRKRAHFVWWELGVFVLPFVAWLIVFSLSKDKTLGNLVEVLILGGVVAVAMLARVVLGNTANRNLVAAGLLGLQCVIAILLGKVFPDVPFHWFH